MLTVECRKSTCHRYTSRQRDSYAEHNTSRAAAVVERKTIGDVYAAALSRSQSWGVTDAFYSYSHRVFNVPAKFIEEYGISVPPTDSEFWISTSELRCRVHYPSAIQVVTYDFNNACWVEV